MTWWLIGIVAYLGALGVVLIVAGGARRGDEGYASGLRELDLATREPDSREGRMRPAAPPRAHAQLRGARRAARS